MSIEDEIKKQLQPRPKEPSPKEVEAQRRKDEYLRRVEKEKAATGRFASLIQFDDLIRRGASYLQRAKGWDFTVKQNDTEFIADRSNLREFAPGYHSHLSFVTYGFEIGYDQKYADNYHAYFLGYDVTLSHQGSSASVYISLLPFEYNYSPSTSGLIIPSGELNKPGLCAPAGFELWGGYYRQLIKKAYPASIFLGVNKQQLEAAIALALTDVMWKEPPPQMIPGIGGREFGG